jgi:sirohydrochlorin ferrochelatase
VRPTLLAVAHGTRSETGRRQVADLVAAVARRRPGVDVRLSYVDVQEPRIGAVVPTAAQDAVVVPLLLSTGYHVRVDIAEAARGRTVTPPLGPDDVLVDSLARHLPRADAVVLAAAGSSDPAWRTGVHEVAARLDATVAYASGSGPSVAGAVAKLREAGHRRIAIAAYLLADGRFYRTLHQAGATSVTPPLCLDPAVADLVLRRYEAALLTMAPAAM